jgi:predicted DNA-binding transcriptional regulator AlpA
MSCQPQTFATHATGLASPGASPAAAKLTPSALRDAETLAKFDTLPDSAHVRMPVLRSLTQVSTPTIYRWIQQGFLPAPMKLGPRVSAWNVGEIRAALAERGAV